MSSSPRPPHRSPDTMEPLARCTPMAEYPLAGGELQEAMDWVPPADIDRTDEAYHVRLEVPGVQREDMVVTVEQGMLVVRGRKRAAARRPAHGRQAHRECRYGEFKRAFGLPGALDALAATGRLRDGLLLISLPWKKDPSPEVVRVEVE